MAETVHAADHSERLEFRTELKQLLDLIIHSLYTKKEIFLRELISNAADAIDRLRFEALKDPSLIAGAPDFRIELIPDEAGGTLTIRDNGIGMTREGIVENLGTIARSGTRSFLESLKQANAAQRPELIGQFGVGFYASFMVADKVTVLSRAAGAGAEAQAVRWQSDGEGSFEVSDADKPNRGTDVTLHLRDDAKEFLSEWRLKEIVKQYSDYIEHPIVMEVEREEDGTKSKQAETLNSRQAIWLRPKNEVKEDEMKSFYRSIAREDGDPLKTIHLAAEGVTEFRALMFIPSQRAWDWMAGPERKSGLDLYVRRVLIQHECEQLAPPYLRFVRGVVDSADLPLNVSRETLQHNPLLAKIKSNVTNRVLKTLEEMKSSEYETYVKFFREFGEYLKEGTVNDYANRPRLADLLLFESTLSKPGEFTTLGRYVESMKPDQKQILYLAGDTRGMLENSPYLEAIKASGQEVLLLSDPIDEYLVSGLMQYKEKPFRAADRGDSPTDEAQAEKLKEATKSYKPLLEALQSRLSEEIKETRLSARLNQSAAVLVADDQAMSAHMERLMQRMGRGSEIPPSKRILELNPDHPAMAALKTIVEKDPSDPRVESLGRLLYDQAVIAEGSRVIDPAAFARRINELIAKQS